jgi:hypothetical protein
MKFQRMREINEPGASDEGTPPLRPDDPNKMAAPAMYQSLFVLICIPAVLYDLRRHAVLHS